MAVGKDNSVQSCLTVGAIHTIPAPNLSLSEKPIVVVDTSENVGTNDASDAVRSFTIYLTFSFFFNNIFFY